MSLKINDYSIYIYNGKKYTQNLIDKMFPVLKDYDYPVYSISLYGKLKKEKSLMYPYFPIFEHKKFFVNPIQLQLIDRKNVISSIQKNIQFIASKEDIPFEPKYKPKSFLQINISNDDVPYKETNHGWLSLGTKNNLYVISKYYKLKNIAEFGTWYGNSAEYIKENNPDSKLLCFDVFRSILESEYTPKGYGIDNFYINYPRLESVYKRMQKFENVQLIKGDANKGVNYLKSINFEPDMIFIDFIKQKNVLIKFLNKIHKLYPDTIIVGDDYVANSVKDGSQKFFRVHKDKYHFITNENSYILIPTSKYIPEVKTFMEKKLNSDTTKFLNNKYTQCYLLIKDSKFIEAIDFIKKEKLNLNFKSKVLPNDNTLYHIFAYFLRKIENKDDYFERLFEIEEPRNIKNNYDFTFNDMLKFDSSRLFSG